VATEPSPWAIGWITFAAIMMVIQGIWWILAGLVAVFDDTFFVVTEEYVFQFDASTWGWIHLGVGVVLLAAGAALFTGAVWARVIGVIVATLAMVVAFAWLPWYPIWALLFIVVSGAVIWALTAHGRDVQNV
jgi:hypothetical protein